MAYKVVEVPKGEYGDYLAWLNTPGLSLKPGKTSVEQYLEFRSGQQKLNKYG